MSDQLVWQLVRGHNSFIRKGINGLVLSAEPGNLYNKHSYKYSGARCYSTMAAGRLSTLSGARLVSGLPYMRGWPA